MVLTSKGVNAAVTHSVYVVSDHSWTETGITWNNKPLSSTLITSFTPTANAPVELDVSQLVRDALAISSPLNWTIASPIQRSLRVGEVFYRYFYRY